MKLLSAQQLYLLRGKIAVLSDIKINVDAGEFVGLIGPNGAGKSSLMRVLAALCKPNSGEVAMHLDGALKNIAHIAPQKRAQAMAYLAQNEAPAWPLSVKNLVSLGRLPHGNNLLNPSAEDEAAVAHALHITDLTALAERPVTELSGGELQRTLLARVFAGQPQLILADEPIAALDIYHQLQVMELLQLHVREGGGVIAALHDLSLAARFCSRLILLSHGKIVADGSPLEVLSAANIEQVYGVGVYVDCREEGVVIIPRQRL
ncbi:MAG TPA: ABC transporter ATP-binding protein [Cellvibrio sp.]|nr:ABC transporter ATP-binding protein [Cellvibrio sp.]